MREIPSSTSDHSRPTRSSWACTRETSWSHGSAMSFSGRRPIVIERRAVVELDDPLAAGVVAEQQERRAAALGLEPLLQLRRRRRVRAGQRALSHRGLAASPAPLVAGSRMLRAIPAP